mgnify:CR=1 FL=1
MKKEFIGIDIGINGGIAIVDENGILKFTSTIPKIGGRVDLHQFDRLVKSFKERCDFSHVMIEDLHAIFGTSSKSNFQFGWINGVTETLLASAGLSYSKVLPRKWQEVIWQGIRPIQINTGKLTKKGEIKYKIDTKATTRLAAKRIYPTADFTISERAKVDHNGIVDSVCLARYCYLTLK